MRVVPWSGAPLHSTTAAEAPDQEEAAAPSSAIPGEPEPSTEPKSSGLAVILFGLFTVAIGMLVAEQVLYGHLSKPSAPPAARPAAADAAATAPAAATPEALSESEDFEMIEPGS